MKSISINIADIEPSPFNQRDFTSFKDNTAFKELVASIKQHGVLEPILVRKGKKKPYELIAGERRWRASIAAGAEKIKAEVLEADDQTAAQLCFIENAHREALTPMEQAITVANQVRHKNVDLVQLAAALGKSVSYVAQMAAAAKLIEPLKKWLLTNQDWTTIGHVVQLARLSPSQQKHLVKQKSYILSKERRVSTNELFHFLNETFFRNLSKVIWDLKDETLPGGACSACQKRASCQKELFPDLSKKEDTCLDGACFEEKNRAMLSRKIEEAKKTHPNIQIVSTDYNQATTERVKHAYGSDLSDKESPKSQPCFDLQTGRVRYLSAGDRGLTRGTRSGTGSTKMSPEQKKKFLHGRRIKLVSKKLVEQLDAGLPPSAFNFTTEDLLALIAFVGLAPPTGHEWRIGWYNVGKMLNKKFDASEALDRYVNELTGKNKEPYGKTFRTTLRQSIDFRTARVTEVLDREEWLRAYCLFFRIDYDLIWKQVCALLPDPKNKKK